MAVRRTPMEETLQQKNSRTWDMVLNLVHPAALYVLFQLVITTHLGGAPALGVLGPLHPVSLGIHVLQFLGAWAVFSTTLLRDMGYRCWTGTVLLLLGLLGALLVFPLFPEPRQASDPEVWAVLSVQLLAAAVAWPLTFLWWLRLKRLALGAGDE